jgi:DNA-binding NtrC family response regulator
MSAAERCLVIDDDQGVVDLWAEVLRGAGYRVSPYTDPYAALARAIEDPHELVLCDVEMPGLRGPALLELLLAKRPLQQVIVITAYGSVPSAVEVLRAGAADFLAKPCGPDTLVHVVRRALSERRLRREIVRLRGELSPASPEPRSLVARSPSMQRVMERARRVAMARGTVLLEGESGTGKTALARAIHAMSPRANGPFIAVNSSTLPEQLAEAELYGSRRGAFTDATQDRQGLVAAAQGGTLFLDEITDLPMGVQAKLLTMIELGTIRPVGDSRERAVDVRLIVATNQPLAEAVEAGRFRADLRYRLDVFSITLPPLRQRREDLDPLVDQLLGAAIRRNQRETLGLSAAARSWIHAWPWPGNVRELANRIERAVVFSDHDFLRPEDLADPQPIGGGDGLAEMAAAGLTLAQVEDAYIDAVLVICGGNKAEAARRLDIDRRTLYRRIDERTAPPGPEDAGR